MAIARRWVFPIVWMVVFAAIAAALVKIAFFPDGQSLAAAGGPERPSATMQEPQIAVARGTIANEVTVDATVTADPAVAVKATLAGEVRAVAVTTGQHVDQGAPIATVRSETPAEPGPDGAAGPPVVRTTQLTAPISGTVVGEPVLKGQDVSVGDPVAQIAPPTFTVSGSLPPEQRYRLLNQPTQAQVTITGGPAPFTCTGLTISTSAASESQDAATTVSCAVPGDVTVFPGLSATLTIDGGKAENVLTVPTTAVDGGAQSGTVYLPGKGGEPQARQVALGLTDGKSVEVTQGLNEGELILQFVPDRDADAGDAVPPGCVPVGPGAFSCGG